MAQPIDTMSTLRFAPSMVSSESLATDNFSCHHATPLFFHSNLTTIIIYKKKKFVKQKETMVEVSLKICLKSEFTWPWNPAQRPPAASQTVRAFRS